MPRKTIEKKPEHPEPVDPKIFNRIFARDKDGKAILDELLRLYYNRPSHVRGDDALETAYREGQRAVVAYINRKTNKEE